ncbi:MAG: dicarboxylate/amino acid:cation symporter [Salibacteraceae bacterium]
MKRLPLHIQIILGLVLGIGWAVLSISLGLNEFTADWIKPWGSIFINLLKLIAVPLVLLSIITGVTSLSDINALGRIGVKTLGMYLITTVIAVSVGLTVVNVIAPGNLIAESQRIENRKSYEAWVEATPDVEYMDEVRLLKSGEAAAAGPEMNEKLSKGMKSAGSKKDEGPLQFVVDMVPSNFFFSLSNNGLMLQIIFFAIFFGVCLLLLPTAQQQPIIQLVSSLNEVFLIMVNVVMKGAPFFVFALMAGQMTSMADTLEQLRELLIGLGWYMIVVILGLALMAFIFYPVVMKTAVRERSFFDFFKSIGPAQLLAFSSSSSAATLPVTMDCVTNRMGVKKEITSFVLPIGATVNMDGTSLYQAIAVIFLAQMHMVDLDVSQQLVIILTATLASIGSAAVPSAGLIMLIIVLQSVGLNPAWIAIIFPVDRLLDMCRTVVNVTGDATVATIIASTEGALASQKPEDEAQ